MSFVLSEFSLSYTYMYTHKHTHIYIYMCVCARANKVHCLTVYNRLNKMGIKRGLYMPVKFLEDYTYIPDSCYKK